MNQKPNEQGSPFSPDANMFFGDGSNANETFTAFSDTPPMNNAPNSATPRVPKKKKKKKAVKIMLIALIVVILLFALLIGSVIASPLLLKSIGDSRIKSGDYTGARTMYSLCLGLYGTNARRGASQALIAATGSEGLEAGISKALESGLKVHLVHDLNGGRFINSNRQEDVVLDSAEQFATLYKATKDKHDFNGWTVTAISYNPDFDDSVIKFEMKAEYSPTVYTISYTNLHSNEQTNPTEYTCETNTITLDTPSRKGYTFISWSGTDIDGETQVVVISQGSGGNRAYIANWSANKYTVEFEPDVPCSIPESMIVTYDDAFKFPELEKRGYMHKGWTDGEGVYGALKYDEYGNPEYDKDGNRVEHNERWIVDHDVSLTPVWELINYKLNYELGGGSLASTPRSSYTVHDEAFEIPNPTRHGYAFLGWTYDGQSTPVKNVKISANSTGHYNFKANWLGNKHTVTLDAQNGTGVPKSVSVVFGSEYSIPTPVRTGYTFDGWYSGSMQYSKGTWDLDEDIRLTAKWAPGQYKITFNTLGAGNVNSITATYGTNVSLPTVSRSGYTFLGWYNGDTKVSSGTWLIPNNVTLTAKWGGKKWTAYLNASGGSVSPSSYTVEFGSKYTLPTPTRAGYTFLGWYNGNTKFPTSGTWTNDGNLSLTAKWEERGFRIILNVNGGNMSGSPYIDLKYGQSYSLPTPTKSGYTFLGWYNGTSTIKFPQSGRYNYDTDVTLVARWQGKTSNITLNADGGKLAQKTVTYSYGGAYTLPTPTKKGYSFLGWYRGSTKFAIGGQWNYDGDFTLTAKWAANKYTITLDPNGGYVSQKTIVVDYGGYYSLPTPSRSGYVFLGWGSNYDISDSGRYELDFDVTLVAFWNPIS